MKIAYWITTVLAALMLLASGFMHITHNPGMVKAMQSLGYPEYMMTILGLAKILAALALVTPGLATLKQWAYAGSTFLLIGAAWSHLANGQNPLGPLVVLTLLAASYYLWRRLQDVAFSPLTRPSPAA